MALAVGVGPIHQDPMAAVQESFWSRQLEVEAPSLVVGVVGDMGFVVACSWC